MIKKECQRWRLLAAFTFMAATPVHPTQANCPLPGPGIASLRFWAEGADTGGGSSRLAYRPTFVIQSG